MALMLEIQKGAQWKRRHSCQVTLFLKVKRDGELSVNTVIHGHKHYHKGNEHAGFEKCVCQTRSCLTERCTWRPSGWGVKEASLKQSTEPAKYAELPLETFMESHQGRVVWKDNMQPLFLCTSFRNITQLMLPDWLTSFKWLILSRFDLA